MNRAESMTGALVRIPDQGAGLIHGLVIDRDGQDLRLALVDVSSNAGGRDSLPLGPEKIVRGDLPGSAVVLAARTTWLPADQCEVIGRADSSVVDQTLRLAVRSLVRAHHRAAHAPKHDGFIPGETPCPVSGRVYGPEDMALLADSALDFWLTTGRFNQAFEKRFAEYLGLKHALTVNSGSSANLVAVSALTSPSLGEKRLKPGDEVLTVAAGFPTTVNPLLQNGLVPVFLDVSIPEYNVQPELLEAAVTPRTRAIMLAHTLGNPFDIAEVLRVAAKHDLWVIEDCCDALGSYYTLPKDLAGDGPAERLCGGFGHVACFSFYPAHHITMGEGGAVATNDPKLKKALESFRDWGRDCWCPPGRDNTCGCRFGWKLGDLPKGYDHKYVYSHAGYNLKITDMQAAVGLAQLDRLQGFIADRKRNFDLLTQGLADLQDVLILPRATPNSDPSWFGYPLTLAPDSGPNREDLLAKLNEKRIGTRLLFGGNLTRQPYFQGREYLVHGNLENTDTIMARTFWIGLYPGLTPSHIEYMTDTLKALVRG